MISPQDEHFRHKKAAYARGLWAERYCEILLRLQGYRLLARRFKTPKGEIDLIMRRGRSVIYVEVKFRDTFEAGLFAVTPRQLKRIEQAAHLFLTKSPHLADLDQRVDLMVVRPWAWPKHILNVS